MNHIEAASEKAAQHADTARVDVDQLVQRARALGSSGRRAMLGITGAPGAGKSTLCAALVEALGEEAVLVSMDGFHLANQELLRLGRRERKGAPDTLDVDGYVALLRRLRTQSEATIYAPTFDRGLEQSIGSAVAVFAETPIVITEGNYLLLEGQGWDAVPGCLDEVWFVDVASEVRAQRLVSRRLSFGDSRSEAEAWVHGVDEANAALVDPTHERADVVVHFTTTPGGDRQAVTAPNPHRDPRATRGLRTPNPKEQTR